MAVEAELRIRTALARIGASDVLAWARSQCTKPLAELNTELGAGVAPVDLEQFMVDAARASGRYDDFVRTEAARRLNEYFPDGFGASDDQAYGLAAGGATWASLFEPSDQKAAHEVWNRLADIMRAHPQWLPQSPDDPLVLTAFEGHSFLPSKQANRLAAAVAFMERTIRTRNRGGSEKKAVENLARVPLGYGYLYGLLAVDGQVCNGGFVQFYENTGGVPAPLAAAAFLVIGRHDFAALVEESMRYAALECGNVSPTSTRNLRLDRAKQVIPPRPFEILDEEYLNLSHAENSDWLTAAMERLVTSRPDLF